MAQHRDAQHGTQGLAGDVQEFQTIITAFNAKVGANGRLHLLDTHQYAETIYLRLLNELFGWSLQNLKVLKTSTGPAWTSRT